jgi:hypothetical protein
MPKTQPGPLTILCSAHRRTVVAVSREDGPVIVHTGGNGEAHCSSQRFIITERTEADRAAVLGMVPGRDGAENDSGSTGAPGKDEQS